uniref:DUF659 domain-containing protein n=1 Tax=Caenorhabditis tropicalis TaxID=1561998 RepID=A0A1I7TA66_9PELO
MIKHIQTEHKDELADFERMKSAQRHSFSNSTTCVNQEANDSLVMAMSTSTVPFRFVRNFWFRDFCRKLNSDYKLIAPDSIRRKLRMNREKYVSESKKLLKNVEKCIISMDGWDGKYENVSIYALFVYFIDGSLNKQKILLGIKTLKNKASAENVGDLITDLLGEYGLDLSKVVAGLYRKKIENFSESENDCWERIMFITCLRRSETLRIEGRIPLPFAITRWGGCVMLSISFLNHYQSITALQKSQKFLLTDNEKADLESFVSVTTPFLEGIQQAEKDSTFSSEILVQFASLFEFIREQNQRKNVVRTLKRETEKRFRDYLSNDFLLLSVYVDPRFAYLSGILLDIEWEEVERLVEGYCGKNLMIKPLPRKPVCRYKYYCHSEPSIRASCKTNKGIPILIQ